LSRQFLAETHHHLESWRERVRPAQTVGARDLRWRLKSDTTAAADATPRWGEEITLAFSPILTRLRMPAGARWLILTARFTGDIQDLRVGVEEFDERGDPVAQRLHPPRLIEAERATGKSVVLIPLSGASAALEVSLSSPFPQREVVLQDFQLEFFRCGEQDRPPLGAVGLTYYGIEDVGRLLRDLITHYEHYRQTAREFSRLWLEYHNGPRLIAEIEQAAGRANAGRPQPTAAVVGS
jgi:hypothetical protein